MSHLIGHLEDEWHDAEHHVGDWFRHHARHNNSTADSGDTIRANPPQQQQEPRMALVATSEALDQDIAAIRTGLENALTAAHDVLDNRVSQLEQHASDVRAVASIADNPLIAAAAGALHVPPDILDGFTRSLSALAAAWPKPAPAVAEGTPEVPTDPAQENQAS